MTTFQVGSFSLELMNWAGLIGNLARKRQGGAGISQMDAWHSTCGRMSRLWALGLKGSIYTVPHFGFGAKGLVWAPRTSAKPQP
jgi:hypothetical protein